MVCQDVQDTCMQIKLVLLHVYLKILKTAYNYRHNMTFF